MGEKILEMRGIDKRFPGVHALKNVYLDLYPGEVHALIGENGAGKSTLMKVLTGVIRKDAGTILYKGKEVHFLHPKEAIDAGISIIHQELNLMTHLTAAQNIYIGREPRKLGGVFIDDGKINEMARALFTQMNLDLDPKVKVADITVAKQQMVEICRALSLRSNVLIMDEPTAALTESEIRELFKVVRRLKESGVGIIYISHRMEELFEISDRITVMRDGQYVDTKKTAETNMDEIISLMVGRTIYEEPKAINGAKNAPVVLSVKNLTCGTAVRNVSFELRKGEILGFAGLMGAGRTEVMRAVFGADRRESGEIEVMGRRAHINSPRDAVRYGIGYLSEDRKRYGLNLSMSVEDNILLSSYEKFQKLGVVQEKRAEKTAQEYVELLNIKTPGVKQKVGQLSGGNQQKAIIAKWLLRDCEILIFDEPTRGIDIGAKNEIYKLLYRLAHEGKSIIMISSELPEILRLSDRIAVMREGKITKVLDIAEATQEVIMQYAAKAAD